MSCRVLAVAVTFIACSARPATPDPKAGDLAWIDGVWVDDSRGAREIWWRSGAARVGFAYSAGRGGRIGGVEFLRIDSALTAAPQKQAVARFPIVDRGAREVRFADPAHDFPKWIHYRREGDTLDASIGADRGVARASWTFRREAIGGAAQPVSGTVCREGEEATITIEPCTCAGPLFCAELGGELLVALFDDDCDACVEARGVCHTPVRKVSAGCHRAELRAVIIDAGRVRTPVGR